MQLNAINKLHDPDIKAGDGGIPGLRNLGRELAGQQRLARCSKRSIRPEWIPGESSHGRKRDDSFLSPLLIRALILLWRWSPYYLITSYRPCLLKAWPWGWGLQTTDLGAHRHSVCGSLGSFKFKMGLGVSQEKTVWYDCFQEVGFNGPYVLLLDVSVSLNSCFMLGGF